MDAFIAVFEHGDYLGALVATVASFALGFVWYHPATFGTMWMKGVGMTEEKAQSGNMPVIFGLTAVVTYLAALAVSLFARDAVSGLEYGIFVGFFFSGTSYVMHTLFEQRPGKVIALGVAHDVVHFGIIGLLVGVI